MLRVMVLAAGVLACACAPGPQPMAASEASEHLERFAAGASAGDVCTPQGRAVLRGAVRAYGAELARAGVAWPTLPEGAGATMRSTDVAVALAFAGGFIEASDLQHASRGMVSRFALANWPQLRGMRRAANLACAQMIELQAAAARLVVEMKRFERMSARGDPARLALQQERLANAEAQLQTLAEMVHAEIAEARERR
ncbi:MAG TPA: hypothetical protein VEF55_05385 [Candidatus Binatia bacterium]|nr:hypothetical protein [Candidatus Binatia bacterium]